MKQNLLQFERQREAELLTEDDNNNNNKDVESSAYRLTLALKTLSWTWTVTHNRSSRQNCSSCGGAKGRETRMSHANPLSFEPHLLPIQIYGSSIVKMADAGVCRRGRTEEGWERWSLCGLWMLQHLLDLTCGSISVSQSHEMRGGVFTSPSAGHFL